MYNLKLLSHAIDLYWHIFLTFSVERLRAGLPLIFSVLFIVCHIPRCHFSIINSELSRLKGVRVGAHKCFDCIFISPESLPVKKPVLFPRPRSNAPNKLKSLLFSTVLHILPLFWSTLFVWVSFNYWIIHFTGIDYLLPAKHLSSTRGIMRKIAQTLPQKGLNLLEKNSMQTSTQNIF